MKAISVVLLSLIALTACTNRSQEGSMTNTSLAIQHAPVRSVSSSAQIDAQTVR